MPRIGEAPPPDLPHVSELDPQELDTLSEDLANLSTSYARLTGDYDMANQLQQAAAWIAWANEQLN